MKIHTTILTTLLCSVGLVATAEPLVRMDKSRVESIAKEAIVKKYADLKSDSLVFDGIWYIILPDGSDSINISYNIRTPAQHRKTVSQGVTLNITETPEVTVTLSNSGKVTDVSKSVHSTMTTNTK